MANLLWLANNNHHKKQQNQISITTTSVQMVSIANVLIRIYDFLTMHKYRYVHIHKQRRCLLYLDIQVLLDVKVSIYI